MSAPEQWTLTSLKSYIEAVLLRTDTQLAALDRLMQSQRADDIRSLEMATSAQAEALRVSRADMDARLDKLNSQREALADAQSQLMPRAEARLLIDALVARVESIQKGVSDLATVIAALRSGLSGQTTGKTDAQYAEDRRRQFVFAVIGVALVIGGTVVTLFLGLR